MKKTIIKFLSLIILCFLLITSKVNADEFIKPVDNTYKPGIYVLEQSSKSSYNLMYRFLKQNEKSAIIVLDNDYDIVYKNVNCNRKCNAGIIDGSNTIIIIGNEAALYFTKTN